MYVVAGGTCLLGMHDDRGRIRLCLTVALQAIVSPLFWIRSKSVTAHALSYRSFAGILGRNRMTLGIHGHERVIDLGLRLVTAHASRRPGTIEAGAGLLMTAVAVDTQVSDVRTVPGPVSIHGPSRLNEGGGRGRCRRGTQLEAVHHCPGQHAQRTDSKADEQRTFHSGPWWQSLHGISVRPLLLSKPGGWGLPPGPPT